MLNKVMIIGHLGADPELRYTQSGSPVTTLRVATDESYTDRDGNRVERTEWHRIVVFQRAAENCNQYLRKGSLVYVEGKLSTRKWQDQNGQDRYTTEIRADRVQFLDRRSGGAPAEGDGMGYAPRQAAPRPAQAPRQSAPKSRAPQQDSYEDLGPAFPSEASTMDDIPF
ncbi:single-stranded DNA-binding protein [uncultured Mailhella sp.]|uniref:single-stranded DNA-binding protein n=1 Tax=uncultured Mailhella sp. TaxID=1981031 RepID=UPI0025E6A358|nr:single-stranded DNA-binding protein [uncultured Mailhella sp.]